MEILLLGNKKRSAKFHVILHFLTIFIYFLKTTLVSAWEAGVLPMNYTRILICIDDTTLSALFPVFGKSYLRKRLVKSPATKRSCEGMNPHFFTAPFYFAFIWFRVRGSGLSWRLRRLF